MKTVLVQDDFDIIEMRDWIKEAIEGKVSMFGRFLTTTFDYRTDRRHQGVSFRFERENDAFYFKMRWG